ncbi:unnamed protein product [Miscanthus lutarioriparius]|uniref:FORGETTER1 second zinc ribbon domain-containing protein n=1 Tax=Miscanthus lutarioriparius TaxID=422564 RepID=A0A811QWD6_9POAL|nr:unnamed protein product [Miscanthus lutarioriparius]
MPRRPRRALPLPGRRAPLAAPSRIACGGCSAVLSVPHGQGRFACPLCGAELAVSPVAAISVVAPPAAVPISPSRPAQPSEVCPGPSSQLTHARYIQRPIHLEQTHGQHPRHSFREEPFTSSRADTGTEIPVVGRLQNEPADPLSQRQESHIEPLDETIPRPSKKKSIFVASPDSYPVRKVHEEHLNQALYASEEQGMPSNSSIHADKEEHRFPNDTVTVRSKQKVGNVVAPSILEQEQTKSLNQAVDEQQADEIPKDTVHADKVQVEFASKAGSCKKSVGGSKGNQKSSSKILMNSSNELPQLRRSKRLVKGSHDVLDIDPIEKIDAPSNQNLSEAPEIERTQADSDSSSPTRYRFPLDRSNEWDVVCATTPPAFNHCTQQAEQFPRTQMYSPETRWALPVASSNSWHDNEIPQESFSGVGQLDRGYSEVHSNPAEMQNQDMNGPLVQEICSDKNCSGHGQLKHHNKNCSHSEFGRQKRNGFTCPSPNGGGHPVDQSFSGACLQNLSASCSRLAASATTTLPTITPPSTNLPLNHSSRTSLHQQPPSRLYSQDAPCGDLLPGPTSNSSKKRRGRAPEKLMEPRKEAERPMLMPSGTDWIVQPPCPKVANTLAVLIKQNYPGIYVSDDTIGNGQSCEHVVYHWHQCPPDIRTTILDEFLKRYKWSPGHEEECQKIFDRKSVRQLMNLFCYEKQRVRQVLASKKTKAPSVRRAHDEMELEHDGGREDPDEQRGKASVMVLEHEDPLKWKPFVPVWMKPKWWEMLCDHWAKDENIKMSCQQRKNRYSGKRPRNAACPPKIGLHEEIVDLDNGGKLGVDIDSPTNILRESVDQRACRTEDKRDQANREAQSIQLGSHSVQRQAGSGKQGRHCGTISVSKKAQCKPLSKSSPVCVSKRGQQPMFTKEQVQEMITQALQGLNEAWGKKFLSLEQKMPSISSSHTVPNGVKESSLAVGRSKRCKLARQDTLDSMDGEDPDAEDDSDYQEEEHSS